jgi:hypothetical protein
VQEEMIPYKQALKVELEVGIGVNLKYHLSMPESNGISFLRERSLPACSIKFYYVSIYFYSIDMCKKK